MLILKIIQLIQNDPLSAIIFIITLIVPLLISISVHEWAHGYTAYKFGDDTPRLTNRLTLNPLAHLDLMGTIALFVIGIGWAKPVLVDFRNIPDKTKQMLVALAGPASNFIMAIIFTTLCVILEKDYNVTSGYTALIYGIFQLVIRINLALCVFNMLPIPPLDGSKILAWILPDSLKKLYLDLEAYGMFILILLMFTVGFESIFKIADLLQKYLMNFITGIF